MDSAKRRAYQEKADAEFRAWSARVDELRARAAAHKATGKIQFYEQLEKLGKQRDSMRERLAELRESGGDAWQDMRQGFEDALNELSVAFHTAMDRFGEETGEETVGLPGNPGTQSGSNLSADA